MDGLSPDTTSVWSRLFKFSETCLHLHRHHQQSTLQTRNQFRRRDRVRLLENRKGQVRVLEAIFASILLLSSLTLIPTNSGTRSSQNNMLSSVAYQVLLSLDSEGLLSNLIRNESWAHLKACVESHMPIAVWFNLTVFDENMTCINAVSMCSGGPTTEDSIGICYICAAASNEYQVYVIRLQVSTVN